MLNKNLDSAITVRQYSSYGYAVVGITTIFLFLVGCIPIFSATPISDGSVFIGFITISYYLASALMFLLIFSPFRKAVIDNLGKTYVVIQSIVFIPFIVWGTYMLIILFQATDL